MGRKKNNRIGDKLTWQMLQFRSLSVERSRGRDSNKECLVFLRQRKISSSLNPVPTYPILSLRASNSCSQHPSLENYIIKGMKGIRHIILGHLIKLTQWNANHAPHMTYYQHQLSSPQKNHMDQNFVQRIGQFGTLRSVSIMQT